jgi:hypothetical protein
MGGIEISKDKLDITTVRHTPHPLHHYFHQLLPIFFHREGGV